MIKFLSRLYSALFLLGKSRKEKKVLRWRFESRLYALRMRRKAKKIGKDTYVYGPGVNVTPYTTIGYHTGWGKNVKIYGDGAVTIGNYVAIAEDTVIYTQNHDYDHGNQLPFGTGFQFKDVTIGDFVWIGMRSFVLPGCTIGEGAIVQALSVVQNDVPPCAIVGGNPARVYGYRDFDHYNDLKTRIYGGQPLAKPQASAKAPSPAPVTDAFARYNAVFMDLFAVTPETLSTLRYRDFPAWDSAGQMALVSRLEETFALSFDADDMYALTSYAAGREILEKKYGIRF